MTIIDIDFFGEFKNLCIFALEIKPDAIDATGKNIY